MTNSLYRVGIVGATWIAVRKTPDPPPPFDKDIGDAISISHASTLAAMPNLELVAVCDLLPELLDDFKTTWADELPDANTYTDHREMLAAEKLDILVVATSDNRHADIVVDGAEAGVRGILCEKPLATSLEDADPHDSGVRRARRPAPRQPQPSLESSHARDTRPDTLRPDRKVGIHRRVPRRPESHALPQRNAHDRRDLLLRGI